MKRLFTHILSLFAFLSATAQQHKLTGIWEGDLEAGPQKLRLVYTVSEAGAGKLKATMQSPQQSAAALPVDTIFTKGDSVFIDMKKFGIRFNEDNVNMVKNDQFEQGVVMTPKNSQVFGRTAKKLFIKEFSSLTLASPATHVLTNGADTVMAVSKYGKGLVLAEREAE
ncbi:MAG: hypothetical protein EOO13_06585, partial [Chitinophagaceae bacterium]